MSWRKELSSVARDKSCDRREEDGLVSFSVQSRKVTCNNEDGLAFTRDNQSSLFEGQRGEVNAIKS